MKRSRLPWLMALLAVILLVVAVFNLNTSANNVPVVPLNVVAGEDFWGSLVSQLGGSKVNVTSIVTDPNADPHEYESSTTDARNFALANYVILNGAGYDSWGDELLSSSPDASRKVLNVATLLGEKVGDNPHFWYSPGDVNRVVNQMKNDLIALDPRDKSYFESRAMKLNSALSTYQQTIAAIKDKYRGTKVAATEDIFTYLAQAAGLDLISPTAFTQAVAEGNDPPADAVVQFEQQLTSSSVKLLVYNKQTITPLTNSMKQLAIAHHIPVVGVSEIIEPQGITFEQWMNNQVMSIKQALDKEAGAPGELVEMAVIEAKDLSAGYQDKIIWKGANFTLSRGEFVGLLGANGAGKTTLFKLLLGLSQPQSGELKVLGSTPTKGNPRIGYVPQRRFIDSDSRIHAIEYVRLGAYGNKWGISLPNTAKREYEESWQALDLVDGRELANKPLFKLSGGEVQRVFLAQALIGKPDILLLDEPLANLDIRREHQLTRLVHAVAKSQQVTVILIAHDINPLLPVVNRIIYIANGKIASGKVDEIVTSETLSDLYDAPVEVLRDSHGRVAVLGVEEAMHHDS